ncbi:MAG: hypothetical protein M3Y58_16700 [Chloroflexota bacterium]|nr:hypothetical protein [Chloroflexota bacterium]
MTPLSPKPSTVTSHCSPYECWLAVRVDDQDERAAAWVAEVVARAEHPAG